jgi:hypothetical protein
MVRGRAYHPQTQGSVEVANKIFKSRLRAAQRDLGTTEWVKLLPLIAWVINTTRPSTLPKGITPYQVWFGREPPNWPHINSQNFNPFGHPLA